MTDSYVTVMDLAPTFLALAGATYPAADGVAPMRGENLADFLAGRTEAAHAPDYVTIHAHDGRVALRQGRWKLVNLEPPFDESVLALYDIETDPGETRDLSAEEPETYQTLIMLWRKERRARGIVLPEDL
jgi:arylsulfatase